MKQTDREFEQRIREELDANLEALDPAIARRLQQARREALDAVKPAHHPFWQPAIGFAVAALLVLAVVIWPGMRQDTPPSVALTDFELIAADDSLQLFEELDFYEWLAESDLDAG